MARWCQALCETVYEQDYPAQILVIVIQLKMLEITIKNGIYSNNDGLFGNTSPPCCNKF